MTDRTKSKVKIGSLVTMAIAAVVFFILGGETQEASAIIPAAAAVVAAIGAIIGVVSK